MKSLESEKDASSIEELLLKKYDKPEEALDVVKKAEKRIRQIQGLNVSDPHE